MSQAQPRIMQVMLSSQNGGAETFFEKLALALADAGVPQCIVIDPNPRREKLLSAHANIQVHPIRFRGIHELVGHLKINLLARRFQPELVLAWMRRAAKRVPIGNFPVVGRLGGYYKLDRFRKCARLIGNTPDLVDYFRQNGIPEANTQFIPNFGDTVPSRLSSDEARGKIRNELGIPRDRTVLLALGRLHEAKAHDTLLKALVPLPETILLLAGDGPLEQTLKGLAAELGIAERVHFLGWRNDTADLFAAADISVFPSRFEPLGNVVQESWMQRKPLIASRATGPAWLIDHEVNGLLFEIDNVPELTACIRRLLKTPDFARELALNGFEKHDQNFSKAKVTQQYIEMFKELIQGRSSR